MITTDVVKRNNQEVVKQILDHSEHIYHKCTYTAWASKAGGTGGRIPRS